MKIYTLIIKSVLIVFILISCSKNQEFNTLSNYDKQTKNKYNRVYHFQRIKLKTKNDLKKLGLIRLLMSNKGKWYEYPGIFYYFTKDGRIYIENQLRNVGYMLWAIKNGKLYINPNNINMVNNSNKFYLMIVKAASPNAYSPDELNSYKYCLDIKSQNNEFSFNISQ